MSNNIVDNVQLDVDGFLIDTEDWNEKVAFELAAAAGIEPLTDRHQQVIARLRDEYKVLEADLFPRIPGMCEEMGLAKGCISELFGDPLVAWQVAGLPKPGIDMAAYMPSSSNVPSS